jgi:DNA polymerase III alpha subunit
LKEKYGSNHCAKIVTYACFHAKGIVRDVGRIFDIPMVETNKLCSLVIERSGGDARASFSLEDTFEEFEYANEYKKRHPEAAEIACKLEGHIRHRGIHAGALVISERDISSYVPIAKLNGEIVTDWEKFQVEEMKLIKFDILGLKTLSVIEDAAKSAGVKLPREFEDKDVYNNIFKQGRTEGVFQFETPGLTKLVTSIQAAGFHELYDCSALFRPSALHSGQTSIYVKRAKGEEEASPLHPLLKDITAHTKGIILYQEQIMKIMFEIGKMSWATAEMSRKIITKSKGKGAFEKLRGEFVNNAIKFHGMDQADAEKLFDVVSTSGSYGFNEIHVVAYSIISYWCAWLKHYHPHHFFAALLKHEDKKSDIFRYLQAARRENIKVEFPHINKSKIGYQLAEDNTIVAGFESIVGIGAKTAEKIIKGQPYASFEDFKKRIKPSKKITQGLVIADAFRDFDINKKLVYSKDPKTDYNAHDKITDDFDDKALTKLIYQHTTLSPDIDIADTFEFGDFDFVNVAETEEHAQKQALIRGIVTEKVNKDKLLLTSTSFKGHDHEKFFEQHMFYLNVNDGSGDIAVQINPYTYTQFKDLLQDIESKPIRALGILSKDGKKMYCDALEVLEEGQQMVTALQQDHEHIRIVSAVPCVSKNQKSYYRLKFSDGGEGLCFRFPAVLKVGQLVRYRKSKDPFVEVRLVEQH